MPLVVLNFLTIFLEMLFGWPEHGAHRRRQDAPLANAPAGIDRFCMQDIQTSCDRALVLGKCFFLIKKNKLVFFFNIKCTRKKIIWHIILKRFTRKRS